MEVLEAWGLADVAHRRPGELSVGRRKSVDIARAVSGDAVVLLADEPAAGLDSWESETLAARLRAYADTGRAVLLVEHDLGFVRQISSRVIVLHQGRIVLDGTVADVVGSELVKMIYAGESHALGEGVTP
jgi:branched-chain amino acid transport system permease protein